MAQNLPPADSKEQDYGLGSARQIFGLGAKQARLVVFGLFLGGIFLLSVGVGLFYFRGQAPDGEIRIITSESQPDQVGEVVVHVDGAVRVPGVYSLKADSRVNEAITKAGGLAGDADVSRLNLAAKITDGQKIYVTRVSEGSGVGEAGQSQSTLININTASEVELDKLPGVGPVTAQKIIASRPYGVLEDLLTKKVVSASVYEKIKESITVY